MELAIINGTYRDGSKLQQKMNQILLPGVGLVGPNGLTNGNGTPNGMMSGGGVGGGGGATTPNGLAAAILASQPPTTMTAAGAAALFAANGLNINMSNFNALSAMNGGGGGLTTVSLMIND